jgi:ketosteroid isomerase-like protein
MASTTVNRNDAMVREFLAAWERRDTEHIMACWAEDVSAPGEPFSV